MISQADMEAFGVACVLCLADANTVRIRDFALINGKIQGLTPWTCPLDQVHIVFLHGEVQYSGNFIL